ncbi:phospholipase D-like domain-containing protein [Nostoc sphaeroides CHAB 2801]|uniref:phospholipase D-like domain-containing protein n=1 Tax=Nostoc sphaeroides TaxID=446679 RepID=UPI001E5EB061|nr:phospholipase D-like domain-containing protein [Nostoc sphaeroides]MCC5633987.1 phospholipase D-like domain-containing protein [Nostoc sphaeroides CHAB 2801]
MNNFNLNIPFLQSDSEVDWERLKCLKSNNITAHFGDIEKALISYISQANTCLGCIAWLTNESILDALSKCEIVSIVVQKEDFLRPDPINMTSDWKKNEALWKLKLQTMYNKLPRGVNHDDFMGFDEEKSFYNSPLRNDEPEIYKNGENAKKILSSTNISPDSISYAEGWETNAVRYLGKVNTMKYPAFPRMHHKFLLFCENPQTPYAVWTGSFNFTYNATNSLENALYITDENIVKAYYLEWVYTFVQSKSLDWKSKYQPELRIGS